MHKISTRVSKEESLHFQQGVEWELLNSNSISFSISSVENKTDLRNTQLSQSSTSRHISLPSIDTSIHGHIDFSFQSSSNLLVHLFLICLIPKYWATMWPVPITISNGSQDLEKAHLEVTDVSSRSLMFQHIKSWILSFISFKLWPPMNKMNHWILKYVVQLLILRCSMKI